MGRRDEFEAFYNWNFLQLYAILHYFCGGKGVCNYESIAGRYMLLCMLFIMYAIMNANLHILNEVYGCVHAHHELNGGY